jgi:hypothetical protein
VSEGGAPDPSAAATSAPRTGADARLPQLLATAMLLLLLVELALRIRFPWDLFVWAESPFMTNQLKLANGVPLFGAPADLNSFVYSPGLEYLTHFVLAPFGLALDIRWCRLVNVIISFATAFGAAAIITQLVATMQKRPRSGRIFWLAFCTTALLIHRNGTSDIPHPDNLHELHAVATLLCCYFAILRRDLRLAVLAMVVAGLGVWAKQTEGLAVVGAGAALLLGETWGRRRTALIVTAGFVTSALSLYLLLRPAYARFYLLDLLLAQGVEWNKILWLAGDLADGRTLLLALILPAAAWQLLRYGDRAGRVFLLVWACLAITAVLPALSAYEKVMGSSNNLSIIELWELILVAPLLLAPGSWPAEAHDHFLGRLRHAYVVLVLISVFPVKMPPSSDAYRYGERLQSLINQDVAAGRRVLVAHGAMPLIRSGVTTVPLDRGNSLLELWVGGQAAQTQQFGERIKHKFYDRIYVNFGYGLSEVVMRQYYDVVGKIPAPQPLLPVPAELLPALGYTFEMGNITIFAARRDGSMTARRPTSGAATSDPEIWRGRLSESKHP